MKFGSSWLWMCNYDHSPKGRIWLGWNADRVNVNVLKIHEQFIHCTVSSKDLSTQIHLTIVNGLHSIHDRLPMWEGIRSISIQHSSWLCAGDSLVDDLDLTEVKSKGAFYSWSNKAHTSPKTLSRIDRVFGNQAWLASHGHVETVYLPPSLSDHSPVLLDVCSAPAWRGRPFRFLNCIADHPDFLDTVSQAWGFGSSVWQKLNSVKSSIKSLNSKQFGNIEEKIDQANVELAGIQNLMAQNPDDLDLYAKESDAIKNRQARNRIDSIFYSNQVLLKDPDAISHEIISFYKSLLGTQAPWLPAVDLVTIRRGKQLSSVAQSYLIQLVSHAELNAALKGIDNTKAPSIDGFNSFFFKRTWHIVRDDIYACFIDFFTKGTMPKQWNCTTITLVPKIPSASHLISKVITTRLAAIIGEVIDDVQTELRELLGVSQGTIPFRPLVEKVTARIQGCMAKHLSYAGRLQLVKSVMFGIQTFWAQIFILLKKILKEIEARFRCFLWTGSSAPAKKSLVAWNYVCLPKVCGGWNLLSLPEWNKAAVTKLLWDIAHKPDNIWVKWVHIYYFKHKDRCTTPTPAKCY
ncbi:uncharacterized protein LOC110732123 [Chenopodium quinoa]|uniref:uncharacterized protein LOC110732123 n=1 Tax=Chenopodium quinoa TaxID=63459 RepID=UPI000B79483C|nr:uncharacterized protein LOC110732123 [Chenopodium quinoa]